MGNEMMFSSLACSRNAWRKHEPEKCWSSAQVTDEQEVSDGCVDIHRASSAQFKIKRGGKRDFHPLLVKLPGLHLQHCFQMLRTEAKPHFFTGEQSVPEFT